jgi:hypothetical protein
MYSIHWDSHMDRIRRPGDVSRAVPQTPACRGNGGYGAYLASPPQNRAGCTPATAGNKPASR